MRFSKRIITLALILSGFLALLVATAPWIFATISDITGSKELELSAVALNPTVLPLVVAWIITAFVFGLASGNIARFLAVIIGVSGVGYSWIALSVIQNPYPALNRQLAEITGLSGSTQQELITDLTLNFWCYLALGLGLLTAIISVFAVFTKHASVKSGRKYQPVTAAKPVAKSADTISYWDELSSDRDPTDY